MRLALASPSHARTCEGMCFQKRTWYCAIEYLPPRSLGRGREAPVGGWSFYKLGKPVFELAQPNIDDLEWETQVLRNFLRLLGEAGIGHLPEEHQRFVVAEDHRLQLRVPVEAEAAHHGAIKISHEPVGQEEGAGLLFRHPAGSLLAREHLIAVRAAQSRGPDLLEQRFELSSRTAVAVHDDQLFVARPQVVELHPKLVDDA